MIRRKLCVLGSPAVGKTSLLRRFVRGVFSDRYLATVGVRIESREVEVEGEAVELLLWDIDGEAIRGQVWEHYVRDAHGYLLVVDPLRVETLRYAADLAREICAVDRAVPCSLLLNKTDRAAQWSLDRSDVGERVAGVPVHRTSAKTGEGVDEAFREIAVRMYRRQEER